MVEEPLQDLDLVRRNKVSWPLHFLRLVDPQLILVDIVIMFLLPVVLLMLEQ
jgi:hypothetical protein